MIQQSVLSYKLEKTNDTMTANAGLVLAGEFCRGLRFGKIINECMPAPGSGAGYKPEEFVFPLVLMLMGGGRSLEDMRKIRDDRGFQELLSVSRIPSTDATGDWLRRMGEGGGLSGLSCANKRLLKRGLKRSGIRNFTLDIDATAIKSEKREAKMTYKGFRGYMPLVGHLGENALVVGAEFREGNESPGAGNLSFIRHCISGMPRGKRIRRFRADSASYQADIINFCTEKKIEFAIGAKLDSAVKSLILSLPDAAWKPYQGGYIARTTHCMNRTQEAFDLIVVRGPHQLGVFEEEPMESRYKAIATNLKGSAKEIMHWYNQRGETSENRIKDLKIGFGMERLPCGQTSANGVFFGIGAIAYNIFRMFTLNTLDKTWHRHQVQTMRWRLFHVAGKITFHGRRLYLKVNRCFYALFDEIRARIWEFSLE